MVVCWIGHRKILDSKQNPEQRRVAMGPLQKLQVLRGERAEGRPLLGESEPNQFSPGSIRVRHVFALSLVCVIEKRLLTTYYHLSLRFVETEPMEPAKAVHDGRAHLFGSYSSSYRPYPFWEKARVLKPILMLCP